MMSPVIWVEINRITVYGFVEFLAHLFWFRFSGYRLAMKLGTISADGKADVCDYKLDDMVEDPQLAKHLFHFGVNIKNVEKVRTDDTEPRTVAAEFEGSRLDYFSKRIKRGRTRRNKTFLVEFAFFSLIPFLFPAFCLNVQPRVSFPS